MTDTADHAATTALLAPWLDHARRCAYGYLDDLAEPSDLDVDLWIDWNLDVIVDEGEWIHTLETMELLDLLVRADYKAGWTLVCEIVDLAMYVGLLDELPGKIYPKHMIVWTDLGADGRASYERAKQLVAFIPDRLHTAEFLRAKATMMQLCEMGERDPGDRIRVCIKLDLLEMNNAPRAIQDLQQLTTLAALAQDPMRLDLLEDIQRVEHLGEATCPVSCDDAKKAQGGVFCVERAKVNTSRVMLTDQMLSSMRTIERNGVQIAALTIGRSQHAPNETSPPATTEFFRSIESSNPGTSMALSIGHDMDSSVFQAVCSILLVTEKVNDVTFTAHNHVEQYWSWIAYSVFSSEASTRIQYAHFNVMHLTAQNVEEVQRVLRAQDPVSAVALASSPRYIDSRPERDPEVVDVRPNAPALVRTRNPDAELAVVLIDERFCTGLRVVGKSISPSHVCVLYPGAGLCWVGRDDVVARRSLPTKAPQLRATALERIGLELGNGTPLTALLALIQLIGPTARILLLYSPHCVVLPDAFLRDVLAACPNLKRLDLVMVTVSSFAWLVDNEAVAHVSQLSLLRVRCLDAHGYTHLVAALHDSTKGVGKSLLELAIRRHLRLLTALWPTLMDSLMTNHRLQRLIIRAESAERSDAMVALGAQLHSHHGDPVHVRDKPLPLRSRLAFLSIFTETTVVPELDAAMLSIVFAFAAPNKQRVCGLAIWTRVRG